MLIFARPGPFGYDRKCQHLHKQPAVHTPSFVRFESHGYHIRILEWVFRSLYLERGEQAEFLTVA